MWNLLIFILHDLRLGHQFEGLCWVDIIQCRLRVSGQLRGVPVDETGTATPSISRTLFAIPSWFGKALPVEAVQSCLWIQMCLNICAHVPTCTGDTALD